MAVCCLLPRTQCLTVPTTREAARRQLAFLSRPFFGGHLETPAQRPSGKKKDDQVITADDPPVSLGLGGR